MVKRPAVAATLASTILFASLLVSNSILVAGWLQGAGYAALANEESALHAESVMLQGVVGIRLLEGAQTLISSRTFDCRNASDEAYSSVSGLSASLSGGRASVVGTLAPGPVTSVQDNLSLANPFDGGTDGGFNLMVHYVESGSAYGGAVTMNRTESHVLGLRFDTRDASSFCLVAMGRLLSNLSASLPDACGTSDLGYAFDRATTAIRSEAESRNLALAASFTVLTASPCAVGLSLTVSQTGIVGPAGPFTWRVGEVATLRP